MQIPHSRSRLAFAACLLAAAATTVAAQGQGQKLPPPPPPQLSALSVENLAKPRPKPPFDLTGMWQHDGRANRWQFVPEKFTLTPAAQIHYDAGLKALKEGGVYRDDIGQCWPAGMPLIMTRVWPIAMVQLPTVIYMISHFENSVRIIYLDGRQHTDPDIVVRTFNGESIGRWEGDTLVVHTKYFPGHHHWMDQGGASVPVSEDAEIIERFKMRSDGGMDIEYRMTDPQNWVGEWNMTKTFRRRETTDISEVQCLPDLNDSLPATKSKGLVK
ncbi:MAG TPA: hypothetical protein VFO31_10080 [Vicinamibacterales bacterium]|nr:hypothetical protein [Vicinamibacterales bacterium]